MRGIRIELLILALILLPDAGAQAGGRGGIGVLGDSYSDEYRFYPPDRRTARNWVEILAEARGFDFGPYRIDRRSEPRNAGFAYNWARSDATTVDLIASGQHTGLADQVARGEVRTVVIFIGGNDYIHALDAPDPDAALAVAAPRALANFRVAVETIMAADPEVRLVLATVPDIRHLPDIAAAIREGRIPSDRARAYSAAIGRFNGQVRALARSSPRTALLDLDLTTRAAVLISPDHVSIGGRRLDRRGCGNDLDHFFLADARHPGTLGQGLMAAMIIDVLNERFGAGIAPLRPAEIRPLAEPDSNLAGNDAGTR